MGHAFEITLTGAPDGVPDVLLSVSTLVWRKKGSTGYAQATVPADQAMIDAVASRPNGSLWVQTGTRTAGVFTATHTLFNEVLGNVRDDRGAGSSTLTLACYYTDAGRGSAILPAAGASYRSADNSGRQWRLGYIPGLDVGDTLTDGAATLLVDSFSLYVKKGLQQFEVSGV